MRTSGRAIPFFCRCTRNSTAARPSFLSTPRRPSAAARSQPGVIDSVVEYDFDIARAVVSYLKSDSFRRYPNIRFIFPHYGGTLPVLANRVTESLPEKRSEKATDELMDEVKQLYFDVAHATYPAPLSALTGAIPRRRSYLAPTTRLCRPCFGGASHHLDFRRAICRQSIAEMPSGCSLG